MRNHSHWHGKVVKINGTYTDVAELLPASMKSGDMLADNPGQWMYHCHVADHIIAGMTSLYTVHEKIEQDARDNLTTTDQLQK
jgi:FtsP/CotA-like multicopper oxidase with cupredoxin domain